MSRHRNRPIPSVPIASGSLPHAAPASAMIRCPRDSVEIPDRQRNPLSQPAPTTKRLAPTDRETDISLSQAVGPKNRGRGSRVHCLPRTVFAETGGHDTHSASLSPESSRQQRSAPFTTDSDIRSIPESPYEAVPYRAHSFSRPANPNICKEGRHSEPKASSHSAPPETIHTGDRRHTDPTATIRHGGEAFRPGIAIPEYDCRR